MRCVLAMAFVAGVICMGRMAAADAPALSWAEEAGKSLSLMNGQTVVWTIHFDPNDPKPYVHPLRTLSGKDLTWLRPPDHPWHHGLWFSWKVMNGVNYWEEDKKTGKPAGLTELLDAKVTRGNDFSATVVLKLSYHPPQKPAVMTETRTLTIGAPQADGSYRIDWQHAFTVAENAVVLDRTKPGGKPNAMHGGYAGLLFRIAPNLTNHHVQAANGWDNTTKMSGYGESAKWVDFSGQSDGTAVGAAIFDHPANPRHPTPWYVVMGDQRAYFHPAILWNDPMSLKAGEQMTLRYRVLVHEGIGDRAKLQQEFDAFAK